MTETIHKTQGKVAHMLEDNIIGNITLNITYCLLLQEKDNTYENRRALSNYERP